MVFKVYSFQKRAFLLMFCGVNWRQHWRNCRIGKTKTKWCLFSTEDLVLIKVFREEKGYDNWWIITLLHCEITVNVHESLLSRKLVFWTSNWKHVIKCDLCVKFHEFLHSVQICVKFSCKNFTDVCPVFWVLCHYT